MTKLEEIGGWLATADGGELGSARRARIGLSVIDTVGAWAAALASEDAAVLARLGNAAMGSGFLGRTPVNTAAFVAAATRSSEIDDIHTRSCTTPGSIAVTTALTLAPAFKANAATVAAAIAAGYGITTRFGIGVNGPGILYRGIWPTYLAMPLTTAAVTARLMALDEAKTAHALAIALATLAGRPGAHRDHSARWLLVTLATRSGIAAAIAAAEGLVGDLAMLDGDFLEQAHGIPFDDGRFNVQAEPADMLDEISIKPWCAAKQTIASITAFRDILAGGVLPDEIAAIKVETPPAYAGMIAPKGAGAGHTARVVGIDYQLALAALKPDDLEDVIRPDLSGDPIFAGFMNKVTLAPDPELVGDYPIHWSGRVSVTTKSGRTETVTAVAGLGDPDRPLAPEQVRAKSARLIDRSQKIGTGEAVIALAERAVADDEALAKLTEKMAEITDAARPRG